MTNRTNRNCYIHQRDRALKRKLKLISLKGMKCEICGYDKNISALEFHHIDPSQKSFPLDSRRLSNFSMDKLIEESKKCILLCSNCHRELHHPNMNKENIDNTINEIENGIKALRKEYHEHLRKLNREGGSVCPVCGKSFKRITNKTFCSKECRLKSKGYPSYDEIQKKYSELHSWEKVADFFHITRKIIRGIRKRHDIKP